MLVKHKIKYSRKYWLWCCNWNHPTVAAFSKIYKMRQNDLLAKAITYSFHIGLLCSRPHTHTDHWLGHSPETVRGTDKNWCTLVPRNQDDILQRLQWRVSYFLCYSVRFSLIFVSFVYILTCCAIVASFSRRANAFPSLWVTTGIRVARARC